jgi:hypothetical protein
MTTTSSKSKGSLKGSNHNQQDFVDTNIDRGQRLEVSWYVGGAETVDETFLMLHDTIPTADTFLTIPPVTNTNMSDSHGSFPILVSPVFQGKSRWFSGNVTYTNDQRRTVSQPSFVKSSTTADEPLFPQTVYQQTLDLSMSSPLWARVPAGQYFLVAWSRVDGKWGNSGQGYPRGSPQSYLANLRNDDSFTCESNRHPKSTTSRKERTCHGHKYWPSQAATIQVLASDNNREKSLSVLNIVTDCTWWAEGGKTMPPSPPSTSFPLSDTNSVDGVTNQDIVGAADTDSEDGPFSFLLFETKYLLWLLTMLCFVSVCSMVASRWRRSRVYTALLNNPYLHVPTGWQRV